ncbi:MAG: LacI family transcriptional regulator [Propionibacteriaceae bacterium]|nr:LacI family transcriptional regulator [Propionibacteriaceae bacterium]
MRRLNHALSWAGLVGKTNVLWEDDGVTTAEPAVHLATSADVARHAGVSRSTVSAILNGNGSRFSPETRQRVQDSADALDYKPSIAGRSLVSGRSDTIVVLVANVAFAAHLQDAVDAVMKQTSQLGGNVVIRLASDTVRATADAVAALRPLAVVDFGVLTSEERDWLEQRGTVIVPDRDPDPAAPRDGGITALQAAALLEHHPQILWFAGSADGPRDPFPADRFKALQSVCAQEGLPEPRSVTVTVTPESGSAALAQILDGPLPAGVACYNDGVALAILAAARDCGVEIPATLAIVGVDNSPFGQLWTPSLTTIDTDLLGMVDLIAVALRARLGKSEPDVQVRHGAFSLIRRETA